MKRKLVTVLLVGVMALLSLTACGEETKEPATATADVAKETKEPATATADVAEEKTDVAEDEGTADGEMVSDKTFTELQDNFALLVETYDAVAELYNSEEIAANPEIEKVMKQAEDVIAQMGEISQDTITEEDAVALNDSMVTLVEALGMIVEGMEVAE